jgi:hypothetical protein
MMTAHITIKGVSPYSQSRYIDQDDLPKQGKEGADDYEKRTWQARIHRDGRGVPFLPAMSIKKSLDAASSYLGKIKGERNATYTKRFKSGLLVTENFALTENGKPVTSIADFQGEWLFLDANGKSMQGSTRVKRCMPRLTTWTAAGVIHVVDEVITETVLEQALTDAGKFVGIGRFRPQNGGFYGRFVLDSMEIV